MENIEWLLVELESNLLIRSIQAKIAAEMLPPATGRNSQGQDPHPGFSGTNDNYFMLPTMVEQNDLPGHQATHATVLSGIPPARGTYHSDGAQHNVEKLLKYLRDSQPTPRVLLDVGAQVVKHLNLEVAKLWLKVDDRLEAVIFVGSEIARIEERRICGDVSRVSILEQLGFRVVYLNEAHTRGTDLKLPSGWKAAVKLGPRLCKDKLV